MKNFYLDWSYKEEKFKFIEGESDKIETGLKKFLKRLDSDSSIYTENIGRMVRDVFKKGAKIYRCRGNDVAELREKKGLEKSDEIDVRLIRELSKEKPEVFRQWKGYPKITTLCRIFEGIKKERVAAGLRIFSKGTNPELEQIHLGLKKLEKEVADTMGKELKNYPIYVEWLKPGVKGVDVKAGGVLIGTIAATGGIENFRHASHLRSYFGVFPRDGIAARLQAGKSSGFQPARKGLMLGVIGKGLIMAKDPYYYEKVYKDYKLRISKMTFKPGELKAKYKGYKKEDTKRRPIHIHRMAVRKMVQVFLDHFWCIWRQLEGLPTTSPYPIDKLKHSSYLMPPNVPERLKPFEPFKPNES